MTTVVFGKHAVATDSRRCRGTEIVDDATRKVCVVDDRYIIALSGTYSYLEPATQWFRCGANPDTAPKATSDTGWFLYVYDGKKLVRYAWDLPYGEEMPLPLSFGSGDNYARAAMMAGADERRAVEIACQLDVYSGGPIEVIRYADVFAPAKPDTPAVSPEPSISDAEVDARVAALLAVANGASRPVPPMVHENIRAA